jgi:hypothetical protein
MKLFIFLIILVLEKVHGMIIEYTRVSWKSNDPIFEITEFSYLNAGKASISTELLSYTPVNNEIMINLVIIV